MLVATEDYSEYESVDEEMDTEPEKPVKGGRSKKHESHGSDVSVKEQTASGERKTIKATSGGAKLKKARSGLGKGNLSSFFMTAGPKK